MTAGRTLFVTWYDSNHRSIIPVARLVHHGGTDGDLYEFRYIRGALEAMDRGFQPFIGFPDLYKVYRSPSLFPFFSNRVMPTTRPDYLAYLQVLGLDPAEADSVEILARSGGRRETDRIEVVPAPVQDESGGYTTRFLLRGIRYIPGAEERIARLASGERLFWMLDPQNESNLSAVALRSADKCLLGYIPDYLVTDIAKLIERRVSMHVFAERVNLPPAPLHHRVLCRLEARWPDGFVPFQGEQFQPVSPLPAPPTQADHAVQ
ncbi:HIRAN domain-containing protein [Sorangium sp. So ce429]